MEIIRDHQKMFGVFERLTLLTGKRQKLINGVEFQEGDTGFFIDRFRWNSFKKFVHHPICAAITVLKCVGEAHRFSAFRAAWSMGLAAIVFVVIVVMIAHTVVSWSCQ